MKKLTTLLLLLAMMISLAACGNNSSAAAPKETAATESQEVEEKAEEKEEKSAEAQNYTVGDTITTESAEITFTESGVSADIRNTYNNGGITIISGPQVLDDKQYVYLKGEIKSLAKSKIDVNIGGQADIDGYQYEIDTTIYKSGGGTTYSLEPLESGEIVLYAAVPNELAESFESAAMIFGFNNDFSRGSLVEADNLYVSIVKR